MTGPLSPQFSALVDQHAAQLRDDTQGKSVTITAADVCNLVADLFTNQAESLQQYLAENPGLVLTPDQFVELLRTQGAAFKAMGEQLGGAS